MSHEHDVPDEFIAPRVFVRVYRLPPRLTDGYCFGGGVPITFTNVDWFEMLLADGRSALEEFIRGKLYFDPSASYLVLGDHPDFTFSMEPIEKRDEK